MEHTQERISEPNRTKQVAEVLSDVAVLLLSNGANSTRTARNLRRIAQAYQYSVEHFFSFSAIVLTVEAQSSGEKFTIVKSIPHYGVNFSIVSEISILSWSLASGKFSFDEILPELARIRKVNSYPEWFKVLLIGLATAALCKIFDGSWMEFLVSFLAAVFGFVMRRAFLRKKFNTYICFLLGAFVSTSVVNLFRWIDGGSSYQSALAACVLWLIPGVPLINGFLDLLEGHLVSGWAKVSMGFFLIFMIAIGFYVSLFLFGYGATV